MADAKHREIAFAKTTRPFMGNVVRRDALFSRLDGTPARKGAWIFGPAGSGKSTLAASYVETRDYRCVWYQLDADDGDIATFFHYLSHAAQKLGVRSCELPGLVPQRSDVAAFSRRYFRQLFSSTKSPVALVLDNLHDIAPDSPLHLVVETAFAQVPKHCCAIVTSRNDPPVSLARMRLGGEMVYVGPPELRIAPGELEQIARLRGHALRPEAVAKLQERTQGWAAGIILMIEHAKISGRIAELPTEATPQVIFDYLAGEIFDRFEPNTQQFLLRIACLPRMTDAVAEALAAEPKAARLLLNLARNDYFVREVREDDCRVYQLHPLLRDFLRERALQTMPDAVGTEALKRAALLLRDAGQLEDAMSVLVECRGWDEIAAIAATQAGVMLAQGRSQTLCSWLELLPLELLEKDPRLLLAYGASRMQVSPRAARRLFEKALSGFGRVDDGAAMVHSCCGIVNAIVLEFDDLNLLDHWLPMLAQLLGKQPKLDLPAAAALIRASLLRGTLGSTLTQWIDRAKQAAETETQCSSEVIIELALTRALAALLGGDFALADSIIRTVDPRNGERDAASRITADLAAALRYLLDGSCETSLQAARNGLAVADAEAMHNHDGWLRILVIAALLDEGDVNSAREELQKIDATGECLQRGCRGVIHYLRGWLAECEGDTSSANRELRAAQSVAIESGNPWLEFLARIAYAQWLCANGDLRGAESQVRGAEPLAERLSSPLLVTSLALTAAEIASRRGDKAAALGCLQRGLATARTHGLRYPLGLRRESLTELCALALRNDIEPECARVLVRASKLVPPAAAQRFRQWPRLLEVCTLGDFKLLRMAAPIEFSSKGAGRPIELLKVLIALGGRNVRIDKIADSLWPNVDADYAHNSFTATLHRLRKIFGDDDALLLRDARLSLNPALCWLDAWALDDVIDELDGALRDPNVPDPDALRGLTDEALALYRGPFLPDESEQPSYIACREQMRTKLLRSLSRLTRQLEESGNPQSGIDCYLRLIACDELCEAFHRNLMVCYHRHGELTEARNTYERLRTLLSARLRIMPSPETQAMYAELLSGQGPSHN